MKVPDWLLRLLDITRARHRGMADMRPVWDRPLVCEEEYLPCQRDSEECAGQITADGWCDAHRPPGWVERGGARQQPPAPCLIRAFPNCAHQDCSCADIR